MPMNKNEEAWVVAAKNGNQKSFEALYMLYYEKVYALAKSILKNDADAEDVLQITFINAWRNISKLENPAAFNTWIQRIAVNQCNSMLRHRKPDAYMDDEGEDGEMMQIESDLMLPEQYAERDDLSRRLQLIINGLSDVQRQTVTLFYFSEMTVEEIAVIMDCSEGTVKSRLFLARKALKTEIEEQERKTGEKFYGVALVPFGAIFVRQVKNSMISKADAIDILHRVSTLFGKTPHNSPEAPSSSSGSAVSKATGSGARHAAASAAKSAFPLWGKIALAGLAAGVIVTGGIVAWNTIGSSGSSDSAPPETTAAYAGSTAPTQQDTTQKAHEIVEIDPQDLPEGLDDFLTSFNYGYSPKEYDNNDLDNVQDTMASMIMGNPSCVSADRYPGYSELLWSAGTDPLGRFDTIGYTVYEKSKMLWIMENIFNIPADTSENMILSAVNNENNQMYQYEQDGSAYLYKQAKGIGQGGYFFTYKNVRYDGEKYYFIYDVTMGYGNSPDAPNMITETYYAEMAQKEIDGSYYWTMFVHSQDTSRLPEVTGAQSDAAESGGMSFSDLPKEYTFSAGAGGWATQLTIDEDGEYTGDFSDMELGARTIYSCNFHGKLSAPQKVNDHLYKADILSFETDRSSESEVSNGVTYKYVDEGRGFPKDSKSIYIYTPETPLSSIGTDLMSWIHRRTDDPSDTLGFYVLAVDDNYAFNQRRTN